MKNNIIRCIIIPFLFLITGCKKQLSGELRDIAFDKLAQHATTAYSSRENIKMFITNQGVDWLVIRLVPDRKNCDTDPATMILVKNNSGSWELKGLGTMVE